MSETLKLKDALKYIEENRITDAIECLKGCKNSYNLELLGVLYSIYGNIEKSYSIFLNLKNKNWDVEKYITYFTDTLKKCYIPLFNKLIDELKGTQDKKRVESMIDDLEKIFPNVELYNIATIFFLSKNDYKSAHKNYEKLKKIDKSFIDNGKYELIFYNKKSSGSKKPLYIGACIFALILAFLGYKNIKLKDKLVVSEKNFSKLNEDLKNSNTNINDLKTEIERLNKEVQVKDAQYNEVLAKKELVEESVQEITVPKEDKITNNPDLNMLSDKETYNLIIKRYKQNKYEDALDIIESFNSDKLPEYKQKELVFLTGIMNENLGNKKEAMDAYKEFVAKYNKKIYKSYIIKANNRINALEKQ